MSGNSSSHTGGVSPSSLETKPRRFTIFQKGLIIVSVPLLFQLALIAIVAQMQRHASEAGYWVIHTKEVLATTAALQVGLVDFESGSRSFALSRNPDYAAGNEQARKEIVAALAVLRDAVNDNPPQRERVDAIIEKAHGLIDFIDREIAAKAAAAPPVDPRADVLHAKRKMDALRHDISAFRAEEEVLDVERALRRNHARQTLQAALIVGSVIAVSLTLFLAYLFNRGVTNRLALLKEQTRHVALGEPLEPPSSVDDEISDVDRAIRDMAAARLAAETQRRASEDDVRLYEDIVKSVPIGLLIWRLENLDDDTSLRLLDANPSASRLLGVDVQGLLNKLILDAFPGNEPKTMKAYADVVRTGAAVAIDDVHYGNDRIAASDWAIKAFPLPDSRLGLAFENISARKAAENAVQQLNADLEQRVLRRTSELRESENRFRLLTTAAPVGIFQADPAGTILYVNPRCEQVLSLTAVQAAGKVWIDLLHPNDRERAAADWHAAMREANDFIAECRYRVGPNKIIWAVTQATALRNSANEVTGFLGTVTDITERKHADMKLQQQLARLYLINQITQSIGQRQDLQSIYRVVLAQLEENLDVDFNFICAFDAQENTLRVAAVGPKSQPLNARLGLDENAVFAVDTNGLGACVQGETIYEPDISGVSAPIPRTLSQAGLRSIAAAPLGVAGRTVGVLMTARRAADGFTSGDCEFLKQLSGHVSLAVQHAELYQALKNAYDDLRQTQKATLQQERLRALGQMASGIAHDINNAISPIAIYSESLLESETNLSPRARRYLTTIQQAIDDVAQTVSRMRDFYRQQEKQIALEPVNLNHLVPQVLDLTRARWRDQAQAFGHTIQVTTELRNDLPLVMGVESEIRDALTNLVFNAVDAMPQGGSLTIRTFPGTRQSASSAADEMPATHVILAVSDTGNGMDEETRQRCLEPFFTTKGERGTGLGLAMVYGTLQRHSGDIEIASSEGAGTTVRLLFPVAQDVVDERAPASEPAKLMSPLKVLIVDDDPLLRKSLHDALQADGHEVATADGGQAGIDANFSAYTCGSPFALVITDLGMPYVDGRAVAKAVKETSPATAVFMLTGWGQRMKAEGDIPPHVDRVLSKPPKLKELRASMAAVVDKRRVSDGAL